MERKEQKQDKAGKWKRRTRNGKEMEWNRNKIRWSKSANGGGGKREGGEGEREGEEGKGGAGTKSKRKGKEIR